MCTSPLSIDDVAKRITVGMYKLGREVFLCSVCFFHWRWTYQIVCKSCGVSPTDFEKPVRLTVSALIPQRNKDLRSTSSAFLEIELFFSYKISYTLQSFLSLMFDFRQLKPMSLVCLLSDCRLSVLSTHLHSWSHFVSYLLFINILLLGVCNQAFLQQSLRS